MLVTVVVAVAVSALVVAGGVTAGVLLSHNGNAAGSPASSASPTARPVPSMQPVRVVATTVRHYEPWADAQPAPGSIVTKAAGNTTCWEGSIVSARADAYRCSTTGTYDGGNLFDPCFASPTDVHRMLCPSEPLGAHRLLAITSARPGASNPPLKRETGAAWDFELAGGVSCRAVSGAAEIVAGQRASYFCSDRRWLWGDPETARPRWTIRSSATLHPTVFQHVQIATAWY